MERLTKRIIFGREVPTAALCNAPSEACECAKSCGSCDFLRDKIFQRLAAYEDTNHTPEECAAAFEELERISTENDGLREKLAIATNKKPVWIYDDEPLCPNCSEVLDDGCEHCDMCDQRIDWSDC